jgi:aldehyde dehydrogenase (NAD+)
LLGLVSVLAPVITGGNACVVIAAEQDPCAAITFAEVVATSDVPPGVINILTGRITELARHLAAHADVNALDLTGADAELRESLEQAAADTVKRVYTPRGVPDFAAAPGTARLRAFLEIKTVWHPTGALALSGGTSY